jgi:hypothetical protein
MESDDEVAKGSVFEEIVRRFGNIKDYQPDAMQHMHHS